MARYRCPMGTEARGRHTTLCYHGIRPGRNRRWACRCQVSGTGCARHCYPASQHLVEIVPASSQLFPAALALYRSRADKDWGLTDCASFVVMSERGLAEALTTDEHFRQAGYRVLLLESTAERS